MAIYTTPNRFPFKKLLIYYKNYTKNWNLEPSPRPGSRRFPFWHEGHQFWREGSRSHCLIPPPPDPRISDDAAVLKRTKEIHIFEKQIGAKKTCIAQKTISKQKKTRGNGAQA